MFIRPGWARVDNIKEAVIFINNKPMYRFNDKSNILHCMLHDADGSVFELDGKFLETTNVSYSKRYHNLLLTTKEVSNE